MTDRTYISGIIFLAAWILFHATSASAAPPYFQKLIESGEVEFEFYDPQKTRMAFPGQTNFFHRYSPELHFNTRLRSEVPSGDTL